MAFCTAGESCGAWLAGRPCPTMDCSALSVIAFACASVMSPAARARCTLLSVRSMFLLVSCCMAKSAALPPKNFAVLRAPCRAASAFL